METPAGRLLNVAFCKTLIAISNAAFNHQSMSFKKPGAALTLGFEESYGDYYTQYLKDILDSAEYNPKKQPAIIRGDAACLPALTSHKFDLVITSPPYANRMSYIRELRPYMYWLGFLNEAREAAELDWQTTGGTWGAATSRLNGWSPAENAEYHSELLENTLRQIRETGEKNAVLLAQYVRKYCCDIWRHFNCLLDCLNPNAELHYIVGNSTFYGRLVPVEHLYAEMLTRLGFSDVRIDVLRKRNSKKALFEYVVRARWR